MGDKLGTTGDVISSVVGWIYFLAWSISFYPQVFINWRRKSVVGLSFDYPVYNILGFSCYSAYNIAFYFVPLIQHQYEDHNDGNKNLVAINDVFFSLHAVVLTTVILVQIFIYEKGNQIVSYICRGLVASAIMSIIVLVIICAVGTMEWLWFFYYLSFVKLGVTMVKYIPQVYLNWKRQSTVGWSIENVLLDFTGGLLSLGQLVFDGWRKDDWSGVTGNPVKFGLGFISMVFDVIFIIQHYVVYKSHLKPGYSSINTEEDLLIKTDY